MCICSSIFLYVQYNQQNNMERNGIEWNGGRKSWSTYTEKKNRQKYCLSLRIYQWTNEVNRERKTTNLGKDSIFIWIDFCFDQCTATKLPVWKSARAEYIRCISKVVPHFLLLFCFVLYCNVVYYKRTLFYSILLTFKFCIRF